MTTDLIAFFTGLTVGFFISAPVGPIGIICIQQTLLGGFLLGFFSGLGAASADTIYASISAFGLSNISNFLIDYKTYIRFFGGIYLIYLGISIFFTRINNSLEVQKKTNILRSYFSTLFLTFANPLTILFYTATIATVNIEFSGYLSSLLFVLGVFIGAAIWWIVLSLGVNLFRHNINHQSLNLLNRLSGLAISIFGIGMILFSLLLTKKGIC